jgi:hypothetical protein
MNTLKHTFSFLLAALTAALITIPAFAQEQATSPAEATSPSVTTSPVAAPPATGQPNPAEMMKQMVELGKPGENHKVIANLAGTWTYTVKFWMNGDLSAKPQESKGSAVLKPAMGGRFLTGDYTGKMEMPGPDGKMKDTEFKGMAIDGYDNVKKRFVASWVDNMGTSITLMEGDYDPATKTLTYTGEEEAIPGMKTKVRQVVRIADKDHHTMEWYEDRGQGEAKTMEINYTRAKAK